jgi:hypothetical protein
MTKNAPAKFDWIEEGMRVRVRWPYERHLGNGYGETEGKVIEREEWIKVLSKNKGLLYMPLFTEGLEVTKL